MLAATKDATVTNWVEAILRREAESAERRLAKTEAGPERRSALSADSFARDWDPEGVLPMTALHKSDAVLVSFPSTDASGNKRRPAVAISSEHYSQTSPDVVIASVASNPGVVLHPGDYVLSYRQEANLLSPTLLQMKIATVERRS